VHEAPLGTIEVRNIFGSLVATSTLPQRNVLPGVVRKIEMAIGKGLWFGRYAVILRSTYSDSGEALSAREIVWVVPWRTQGWKVLLAFGFVLWVVLARKRFRMAFKMFWYEFKTGLPPPKDL
jgi:hypothetical protein